MRVVILHDAIPADARPDERDNLAQVEAVAAALDELGHEHRPLVFSLDLDQVKADLQGLRPDVVFNLVEAPDGTGRLIHLAPALLDRLGLAFTGSPVAAMVLASHKPTARRLLDNHGIPLPPAVPAETEPAETLAGPYIIKSAWEDASIGLDDDAIYHPKDLEDLRREVLARAPRLGGEAFAEAYIDGREFNLSLLERAEGVSVLPVAEIEFVNYPPGKPRILTYQAKWQEGAPEYVHTPRRFDFPPEDGPLIEELRGLALECWRILGLRGYARVDFRVDARGRTYVLEANPNPCLEPEAGFAAAARRAGLSLTRVVEELLEAALRQEARQWR